MQPLESLDDRLEMASMHDDVLSRIDSALEQESYIDACWYAYACFESRIERMLLKLIDGCPKPLRSDDSNPTGITTKIECLVRLCKNGHPFLDEVNPDTLNSIKGWCSERNHLVHKLVTLERYAGADADFRNLALRSRKLVESAYAFGSAVRNQYYEADIVFPISVEIASKCRCRKQRCIFMPNKERA